MTKEEFNKIWKDSTREEILNQYYYDYTELKETINKAKDLINNACPWLNIDLRDDDEILQVKANFFKKILQILQGEDK